MRPIDRAANYVKYANWKPKYGNYEKSGQIKTRSRHPKKIRRHTFETIEDKYRFVDTNRAGVSVEMLCRLLEISRSGYYAWKQAKPSLHTRKNQEITRRLVALHTKYPARRLDSLYHMLHKEFGCSKKRVHGLMQRNGISSARRRAYCVTTNSEHAYKPAPNLLNSQFNSSVPNTKWGGDITYIPTGEGWLYAAIVNDLCTKKVVGYAFSNRIDTSLTISALEMAIHCEHLCNGLVFHNDRGVQYASQAYRDVLVKYNIRQSMSRKSNPYDNAAAENFFSCLKCELIHLTYFPTRTAAQTAVFSYIETFYNAIRPHSSIGWLSPNQYAASLPSGVA